MLYTCTKDCYTNGHFLSLWKNEKAGVSNLFSFSMCSENSCWDWCDLLSAFWGKASNQAIAFRMDTNPRRIKSIIKMMGSLLGRSCNCSVKPGASFSGISSTDDVVGKEDFPWTSHISNWEENLFTCPTSWGWTNLLPVDKPCMWAFSWYSSPKPYYFEGTQENWDYTIWILPKCSLKGRSFLGSETRSLIMKLSFWVSLWHPEYGTSSSQLLCELVGLNLVEKKGMTSIVKLKSTIDSLLGILEAGIIKQWGKLSWLDVN